MTPLLLTLAGIISGDGGSGGGAAREPVAVKLGDGLKGFIRLGTAGPLWAVEIRQGTMYVRRARDISRLTGCTFQPNGAHGFWLRWNDYVHRGTIEERGGRLILTIDERYIGGRIAKRVETIGGYIPWSDRDR
jgi:hypothetical protein